jgi:hypothetical protein
MKTILNIAVCALLAVACSACNRKVPVLMPPRPGSNYVPRTNEASHVVETGEDAYSVAMRWGVPLPALQQRNGLEGAHLTVGQTLIIPPAQPLQTNAAPWPEDFILCVEEP